MNQYPSLNLKSALLRYIIVLSSVLRISAAAMTAPVIQVQLGSQMVNHTISVTLNLLRTRFTRFLRNILAAGIFLLATGLSGAGPFDLTNGLVAYYPFNGNAQDGSGNNRHGSVVGPTLAADRFGANGRAYLFDGVNDYIVVSSRLTSSNPFTWCAWIKPSNSLITQTSGSILSQQDPSTRISPNLGFNYPNGKIHFFSYTYQGLYTYSQLRSFWDTSQWIHVVVTSDPSGQRKIFINGSLEGSASGQEFGEQNARFIVGCDIRGGNFGGAFAGLIDDVRVYGRALGDAEVTSLYEEESTTDKTTITITAQPQPTSVLLGNPISLNVVATGGASLYYQWQKDGVDIPAATSSSYNVASAEPIHIGDYSVRIANNFGDSINSATATLIISDVQSFLWKGLVGYYTFDEDARDLSFFANHGSVNGAKNVSGRSYNGRAYEFDGIDNYIEVGNLIRDNNVCSFGFWFYTKETALKPEVFIAKNIGYFNDGIMIYPQGDGVACGLSKRGGYETLVFDSGNVGLIGKWNYVICCLSRQEMSLYVNGELRANSQLPGLAPLSNDPVYFGRSKPWNFPPYRFFTGLLDDVRVYDRALSATEASELYLSEITQNISFGAIPNMLTTDSVTLTATGGGSGNPITFVVTSGPGVISNGNMLSFTGPGLVTITASQLGSASYLPAEDVSRIFNVTLTPETDILVSKGSSILSDDGSEVSLGGVYLGQNGQTLTLAITNSGTAELNGLSVSKDGANAADFSVSPLSAMSIPVGGDPVTFRVTFSPTAVGTRSAAIHISSNVTGTKNSFDINLTGSGLNNNPRISDLIDTSTNEDIATSPILFSIGDVETDVNSLTLSAISSNTALVPNANIVFGGSGANRTITITPAANQFGTTTITVAVSDGTTSASGTFNLTVNAVNDAPTISDVANQGVYFNQATGAIAFTVNDLEMESTALTVRGSSSNLTLVPNANIVFGGDGANRTITVTPKEYQSGVATVTITASDGVLTGSKSFLLQVGPPEISVEQVQGVTIADGGFYDIGSLGIGGGVVAKNFTIKNTGVSDLTVQNITLSGVDQKRFRLLDLPTAPVVPGGNTTFAVQVISLKGGLNTAVLRIASNDEDESTYSITLVATGVAANIPSVTTSAASGITLDGAILNGSVKANNLERTVFFDYGPTTGYGSSVAAAPATVSGNVATSVSAVLSNLLPHTKYHYRVRAASILGSGSGANLTFTTANRVPVVQDDEILALPSAKVVISPLLNDNDEDGDTLSIASDFTQPGKTVGSVTKVGSDLVFTPAAGFTGGSFKYSAVDAFGGKATATIRLILDNLSMGEDALIPANSEPYDLWVSASAPWKASESIPWLSIEPFMESGYVHVIPARNPTSKSRTGTVLIGGKTHTVTQTGNGAPVAVDDEILALPSASVIISPLMNDSDPDSDVMSMATDFTQPGKEVGTLVKVGTDLVFTPTAGFTGGSFTYSAMDAFGGKSNTAIVKLTLAECTLGENVTIPADSPPYDLTVTATAPWNAIESIPWLSVEAPTSNASQLRLIPEGNPSKESRTGTVIIGGKTHTVTQTGITLSPVLTAPGVIPSAVIGSNYDLAIPTLNGPVTYTALGMPKGMTLSNITGRISGIPTVTGDFTLTLFAKNVIGDSNPISFDIKVLPFPKGLAGNYSATIADSALITDKLGGLMTMSVTTVGSVTGTLKIGTGSHAFTGRLKTTVDPLNQDSYQAVFQTTIARKSLPSVVLTVNLNATELISGNVSLLGPEPEIAGLTGSRHVWNAENSLYDGRYTTVLSDNSGLVQGDGFLTFTVSQTGAVAWSGQLADGTVIATRSATLWANGQIPLFALLYGNKGSLNQTIGIDGDYSDYFYEWERKVSGSLHWVKKPQAPTTRAYADGFETTLSAAGAEYSAKEMLEQWPPNSFNIAWVGFEGGGIEAVAQLFTVSKARGAVVARVDTEWEPPNPAGVKLSVNMAQGTFTGSMTLRDPNPFNPSLPLISRSVRFTGVLNFLTGNGTGYLLLPSIVGPPANVTSSPVTSVRVVLKADNK